MCLFAPTELILAADAIPVRVNSGWYDTSKLGDRVVPVEVCPVIRSTIGAKMIELSPFLEQSDALISVLTCDGMTKLSEILSDYKTVWGMNVPRIKDSTQSLRFWNDEIKHMKTQIETVHRQQNHPQKPKRSHRNKPPRNQSVPPPARTPQRQPRYHGQRCHAWLTKPTLGMTRNGGQRKLKLYAMNLRSERNAKTGFALLTLRELWLRVHRCFGLTTGNFPP